MKIKIFDVPKVFPQFSYACFILAGQDSVQIQENIDQYYQYLEKTHQFIKTQKYEIDRYFDWAAFLDQLKQVELFPQKTLYILRVSSSNFSAAQQKHLMEMLPLFHLDRAAFIFIFEKIEKAIERSSWFQAFNEQSYYLTIWPLEGNSLVTWFKQKLQKYNLTISPEALQFLLEQMAQNTLALQQSIEQFALIYSEGKHLEIKDITQYIHKHSIYTIFDWMELLLQGNAKFIIDILKYLKEESTEATLILWAIAKVTRILAELHNFSGEKIPENYWKKNSIWPKKQPLYMNAYRRFTQKQLYLLLRQLWRLDEAIKTEGNSLRVWDGLAKVAIQFRKRA